MRIIMWTLKLLDTESCTAFTANNNVYICMVCVCVLFLYQVLLAITQLSDLAITTEQTYCKQLHRRPIFNGSGYSSVSGRIIIHAIRPAQPCDIPSVMQ